VDEVTLRCEVEFGGMLCSKKGCNLPRTVTDLPAIGDKDKDDILFGIDNGASARRSSQSIKQSIKMSIYVAPLKHSCNLVVHVCEMTPHRTYGHDTIAILWV